MVDAASTETSPESVCGHAWCQCGMIIANYRQSMTPFFFADNNFTRRRGPNLPRQFVDDHGHEMYQVVMLEAVGNVFPVQLQVHRRSRDDQITVRLGLGWASFFSAAQVKQEDLLFFTLEGKSRFSVGFVRGHSRKARMEAQADAATPNRKRKLESDELSPDEIEEVTPQVWHAAKERSVRQNSRLKSPGEHPLRKGLDSQDVVELSSGSEDGKSPRISQDAFQRSEPLSSSDSDTSLSSDSDGHSNFENESEFTRIGADLNDYTSS